MKDNKILYFVSTNNSKFKEISAILKEENEIIVRQKNLEIPEPKTKTLEEISRYKANYAFKILKRPLLVDDTGIIFEYYKNFPGPISKLFFNMVGFDGILKIMKDTNRKVFYKSVITYTENGVDFFTFIGKYKGTLAKSPSKRFNKYFPYDSIFIPKGGKYPRVEENIDEQIKNSHRRVALKKFVQWLENN